MSEKDKNENKEKSLRMFLKRMIGDDDVERKESREIISALIDTGDKAKSEVVRMVAKEARNYIEALDLHKDLHHLLTNYSLEVNASFSLKPLNKKADSQTEPVEKEEIARENDD